MFNNKMKVHAGFERSKPIMGNKQRNWKLKMKKNTYKRDDKVTENRENVPSHPDKSGDSDKVSSDPKHWKRVLPDHMRCTARSKRHGGRCGAPAMANGKCYHHGGKNGPHPNKSHPNNRSAMTHGAFVAALQSDEEKELFQSFIDKMYTSFPDLNKANDLAYVQIAAMSYIQLIRGIRGGAAGSTIDELSRVMNRHLTALKVNREQRDAGLLGANGPKSPSELAILLIQKVERREIHHISGSDVKELPEITSGHITSRIARAMQTGEFPMLPGSEESCEDEAARVAQAAPSNQKSVADPSHTIKNDVPENKDLDNKKGH